MDIALSQPKRGGTQAAQRLRAVATREALLAAARILFTEKGYADTGTHDLVALAAVTRGALYHHFTGKEAVFEAVFHEVLQALNKSSRAEAARLAGDVWSQVVSAFTAYLKLIAANPQFQRILLIDGPAVLGWRRWREMQAEHIAADTTAALKALMKQGIIAEQPAAPLARLVQAALHDAALTIAYADDPQAARIEAGNAFMSLLEGLNLQPGVRPVY